MTDDEAIKIAIDELVKTSRKLYVFKRMYDEGFKNQEAGMKRWAKVNQAIEILRWMVKRE